MSILARRLWIWLKTMFLRVTISKITTIFFLFSFAHCFVQSLLQSVLFSFDENAQAPVASVLTEANVNKKLLPWLTRHHDSFNLKLCTDVPIANASSCTTVFQSGEDITVPPGFLQKINGASLTSTVTKRDMALVEPNIDPSTGEVIGVFFTMKNVAGGEVIKLDSECTSALIYANQVLKNSKREELALIGSEFWLFGISVFAIMYDSIPHLLAGLFMRVLSTGWSAYTIWRTGDIHKRFQVLVTNGPCGVDLFPGYFTLRRAVQIADLSLNFVALLLSCYLVWKLVKTYAHFMFTRVGAPEHVVKLVRFFLGVYTCLQLAVYVLVGSTALWLDQLINGAIAGISLHTNIYLGLYIFTIIALIPWLAMGWFSVRLEMKRTMLAFLTIGFVYFTGWTLMYYSQVFRWTWIQWPFFASLTGISQVVLVASIILGVICWRHFHEGLSQFFYADNILTRLDFEPELFPHKPNGNVEKQTFKIDLKHAMEEADVQQQAEWDSLPDLKHRESV